MIFEVNKRKHLRSPFARKYIIVFHWFPLRLFLSEALIGLNGKHIQEHDKMATKLLTSKLQGRKKLLKIKFVKHFAFYNWAKSSRKPFIITLLFFLLREKISWYLYRQGTANRLYFKQYQRSHDRLRCWWKIKCSI